MKSLGVFSIFIFGPLLFSLGAMAKISSPCALMGGNCSEMQWEISEDFDRALNLPLDLEPGVFSGECYHNEPYDNEDTHHGVGLLERFGEYFHFAGQFAFFKHENVYRDWSLEQARQAFPRVKEKKRRLKILDGDDHLEFGSGARNRLRYWFRYLPEEEELLIFGLWDIKQFFLCRWPHN